MVIGSEKDAVQMGGTAGSQLIAVDFIVLIRKKNNFQDDFGFASGVLKMKTSHVSHHIPVQCHRLGIL